MPPAVVKIRPLSSERKLSRGLADQLAEQRATRAQLRAIGAALEAMDRAAAQGKDAVDQDLGLPRSIAEATGNPQFSRFLQFIGRHLIPRRIVSGMPRSMGGRRAYLE